jgi:hypothetical protein
MLKKGSGAFKTYFEPVRKDLADREGALTAFSLSREGKFAPRKGRSFSGHNNLSSGQIDVSVT